MAFCRVSLFVRFVVCYLCTVMFFDIMSFLPLVPFCRLSFCLILKKLVFRNIDILE
uniref:Candidate secreted effector n=1 Tax=Meloidogyne incognita TaxID=6306 RepID=A0A914LII8_MELIC